MPEDLSAVAAANSSARRDDAAAIISGDATGRAHRFVELVSESAFGSNVDANKITACDSAEEVLDTRRFHTSLAGDAASGQATFVQVQEDWLVRREGFEDLWLHGRRLVYGAVNAGGMGTEGRFGPFCLVIADPQDHGPDALAVFPGDSAQRYTTDQGDVDRSAALTQATAWADRARLAVIERWGEAESAHEDGWPQVLCRQDHYLEAVRAGALPTTMVTEVRMRPDFLERLRDLSAREIAGVPMAPDERNEAAAYDALRPWRRSHGAQMVEVA